MTILRLIFEFFKTGLFAVGGGLATLPFLYEIWKRSVFVPIPKKGNAKECSNYRTIALMSHASKVMLKILQEP